MISAMTSGSRERISSINSTGMTAMTHSPAIMRHSTFSSCQLVATTSSAYRRNTSREYPP